MLLYINANSNKDEHSTTSIIANAFVDEYLELNKMKMKRVDLIDYSLPELDRGVYADNYSEETLEKLKKRNEALEDFIRADVVVITAPMWNFLYPAVLKTWIDAIVVARKTFKYTSDGPIGLVGDKKVLFVQSSGGNYERHPEMNHGLAHLKTVMKFMGINDLKTIIAGGTAKHRTELQTEKVKEAVELATTF